MWEKRRRRRWHVPEHLPGQRARDAKLGRRAFYVYLLETNYGHYVGHTANVKARIRAHSKDTVYSTAGGAPRLLWVSDPLRTRGAAARFEAALKTWRDQRSKRFWETTGHDPMPFDNWAPSRQGYGQRRRRRRKHWAPSRQGCGVLLLVASVVVVVALSLYWVAF